MNNISKAEELERARKSISLGEERISLINQRLPELEASLEKKILKHELKGYQDRGIKKTQKELEGLQREKVTLEKTIEVLKKNLPGLEREAKLEVAEKETAATYQQAHADLIKIVEGVPSLDAVKGATAILQEYSKALSDAKGRYLSLSKNLADIMVSEKLDSLDSVSLDNLREDRTNIDFSQALQLSDDLIDLNEEINKIQYQLFYEATNIPLEFALPPEKRPGPEISPCGNYKIAFENGNWEGYVKETLLSPNGPFENWKRLRSTGNKITFEELKKIDNEMREEKKKQAIEETLYEKTINPFKQMVHENPNPEI